MKKLFSFCVAFVMLFSVLGMTAFADGSHSVTINSETDGHTYQAYQIFAGDYSSDGSASVLANITWGKNVNGASLLAALKADATYGTLFAGASTAAEVADIIAANGGTDGFADGFAAFVSDYLTGAPAVSGVPAGSGPYEYTISGLDDGYYFINEAEFGGTVDNSYTKFMLQVVGDVEVTAKTDKPAVAKKVLENNDAAHHDTWNDAADYSIGDAVPFRIVGLVPDMSNFSTYYYQIADTLSAGLTLNQGSIKVYYATGASMYAVETAAAAGAGGALLSAGYTAAPAQNGFTLTFDDLKTTAGVSSNGYIVVEYTATLNENAVATVAGNPNEVYLTYSNNPNGDGTGETPKDEVVVFTFNLPVSKVDNSVEPKALTGATFALFTDKTAADAAALNPSTENLANALTFTGAAGSYVYDTAATNYTLASDAQGKYAVKGLDQGTYYLVEIAAPTGYNRLQTATEIVVEPNYDETTYVDAHIPDVNDQLLDLNLINESEGVQIINSKGATLPATGGVGTTIFTVGGGVLMLGAGVVLVTKKKMSSHKDD